MDFSFLAVQLYRELGKDDVGRTLGRQFLRAATSIGANIHEAQAGQSRADFVAKVSIAHKEARETAYWLVLIGKVDTSEASILEQVCDECSQITKIIASILLTSKCAKKHERF